MKIRSLEGIGYDVILKAFNHSFSDYFIPVKVTQSQFTTKLKTHNIDLSISVGAFDGDELVGFILHGKVPYSDRYVAYNLGTGVTPEARGQNLTARMYEYIIPHIKGCQSVHLEVITQNTPAINSYKKSGFAIKRDLLCFRGVPPIKITNSNCTFEKLKNFDWQLLQSFRTSIPTIQNSPAIVQNRLNELTSFGAYLENKLVGFIIFNSKEKSILQLAVKPDYRRMDIGRSLLAKTSHLNEITILNIDKEDANTIRFLMNLGLNVYVEQYEMELGLERANMSQQFLPSLNSPE
ncbi:MAG: GNAT family N-acetyltransferase [Chlorobiota bacterium]